MTGPRATVLIPTHDNGEPLRYALASALTQTVTDLEVFVVGDGCSEPARAIATDVAADDDRVRFFDFAKGPRHGELLRHRALADARGEIVCYLSDDDLWLPDHVERLLALLADGPEPAHFAGAATLLVHGDGRLDTWLTDLADPTDRARIHDTHHDLNLSAMAHRLDAYRRLPHGWRTTPEGWHTDHWMTRQWLEQPWVRAASGTVITNIHPANSLWRDRSPADKLAHTARWADDIADEQWRREQWPWLIIEAQRNGWARSKAREWRYHDSYEHVISTRWWRVRRRTVSSVGSSARWLAGRLADRGHRPG